MENSIGFIRLLNETKGMSLDQFDEWLKSLTLDELDNIVFATEYISKQAVKIMNDRSENNETK